MDKSEKDCQSSPGWCLRSMHILNTTSKRFSAKIILRNGSRKHIDTCMKLGCIRTIYAGPIYTVRGFKIQIFTVGDLSKFIIFLLLNFLRLLINFSQPMVFPEKKFHAKQFSTEQIFHGKEFPALNGF